MSKEAIELLKKALKESNKIHVDYKPAFRAYAANALKETRKLIDQVLVLSQQQPRAGEFTKLWRRKLENAVVLFKMGKSPDEWFQNIVTGFREACDRLDTSEARLKVMYAGDLSPESRLSGYKVIVNELRKENADLKAAIAKAKQGGKEK